MDVQSICKAFPGWEVEAEIGRGSYGSVYCVVKRDNVIVSRSAVKCISVPPNISEIDSLRAEGLNEEGTRSYLKSVVDRFVDEIRTMISLKDAPNIVRVEDYKVEQWSEGTGWNIFIRMELLTPLNSWLCDRTITEEETVKLGIDICRALEVCEKQGIIHRDVKPENIFVNSLGTFKLGDFGIARRMEGVTESLTRVGTQSYMAPEVALGQEYDGRADLYSLGLTMYRLLNGGRMPFLSEKQLIAPAERREAAEKRLSGEKLPRPANASDELADIILTACAFDPRKRYADAAQMRAALENEGKEPPGVILKRQIVLAAPALALLLIMALAFLGIRFFNRPGTAIRAGEDPGAELTGLKTADTQLSSGTPSGDPGYASADVSDTPSASVSAPAATPTSLPATSTAIPAAAATLVPAASTSVPTATPTAVPSATPTSVPTATPTSVPTKKPTSAPTAKPTSVSTATPTQAPSTPRVTAPVLTPEPDASTASNLYYLREDDHYSLVGVIEGKYESDTLIVPSVHKGKYVKEVRGFENQRIVTLVIHEGIDTIGTQAFHLCSELRNVTLPESLVSIYANAFYSCSSLKSLRIPSKVSVIDSNAFGHCVSLRDLTLPESLVTIGEYAFTNCTRLEKLELPEGLDTIQTGAFSYCSALTSVTIPDSVAYVDEYAFLNCVNLSSVRLGRNVKSIRERTFSGCEKLTSVTIPAEADVIHMSAFENCTSLTSVTFEDPDGWTINFDEAVDLTDPAANAKLLTDPEYVMCELVKNN